MNAITRTLLVGMLVALAQKGYALTCERADNKATIDYVNIDTSIAVPSALPKDTVLWRSPTYDFSVRCYQERENTGPEDVYFYLSPDGQGALGSDLEVGINLNGEDLRCSSLPGCRQKIGMHFDGCWTGGRGGCEGMAQTKQVRFQIFLSKLAAPAPGKEGPITGVNSYALFQFDGVGGINNLGGRNLRMYALGMNNLRYVACTSTLSISPKTLNFQILQSQFAAQNLVIKELPFSITANKSCNSAYGLNAMFIPASNTTLSSTDTLLAKDNPTVGIRLLNEDRSVISIGKEFEFIPYAPTQTTVTKNFLAQLRWMTSRPILGPFNATAAIEVYYK